MKASLPRRLRFRPGPLPHPFRGWQRALLPLLVALALNGVLFLPTLRMSSGPTAGPASRTLDDTPELLRFSRRQAREPGLQMLPLPSQAGLLPPPPPAELASPNAPALPKREQGKPDLPPHGGAGAAGSKGAPGPTQEPPATEAAGLAARMLTLALGVRAAEGEEASSLQGLWEQATVTKDSPPELPALPQEVEVRQMPLAKARTGGLPLQAPQAALTGGRVLLLWPAGQTLWIVRQGPA
ncbi:MAG: hypothetical protein ER33_06775 [Cyanobium sp. CACIAM 14]|nr:MAG: hypothetical protein ER33_06775 [Cyanobium sp. CACIAM 14]